MHAQLTSDPSSSIQPISLPKPSDPESGHSSNVRFPFHANTEESAQSLRTFCSNHNGYNGSLLVDTAKTEVITWIYYRCKIGTKR